MSSVTDMLAGALVVAGAWYIVHTKSPDFKPDTAYVVYESYEFCNIGEQQELLIGACMAGYAKAKGVEPEEFIAYVDKHGIDENLGI